MVDLEIQLLVIKVSNTVFGVINLFSTINKGMFCTFWPFGLKKYVLVPTHLMCTL